MKIDIKATSPEAKAPRDVINPSLVSMINKITVNQMTLQYLIMTMLRQQELTDEQICTLYNSCKEQVLKDLEESKTEDKKKEDK